MSSDSPRPGAEVPPLDAASVQRLRELDPDGRHGVLQRVLQTFESSLQRQLALVAEARDRGDAKAVGSIAHMLKSSSASIGALAFSARCAEIERLVRSGAPFDMTGEVENLLTEGAHALAAVRAMLEP